MPFNPKAYSLTSAQQIEKLDARRKFEEVNKHRALPFFVKGLQKIVPPQYPGDTSIILAKSYEGKSTILKSWAALCESEVTEQAKRAMTVLVSHEDTAEASAEQQVLRYQTREKFQSAQMLFIGRSFGMKQEDIAEMYMGNIEKILEYASIEQFAEKMPFSAIFYDYLQRAPPDPERRKVVDLSQVRAQMKDDMTRLCNLATTYACPIVTASQAGLKSLNSPYSTEMPIPGPGDTDEAKEIYQIPDRVYSVWQVAQKYPPGTRVLSGNWNFKSEPNLVFLWIIKFRYHQPNPKNARYAPIGRVFPLHIDDNGNYEYDIEFHKSITIERL